MNKAVVTLELPVDLYGKLQTLAAEKQTNPLDVVDRLITTAHQQRGGMRKLNVLGNNADLSKTSRIDDVSSISNSEAILPTFDSIPQRIPGLHAGTVWMSDDFDEPLPDEFWLGEADEILT